MTEAAKQRSAKEYMERSDLPRQLNAALKKAWFEGPIPSEDDPNWKPFLTLHEDFGNFDQVYLTSLFYGGSHLGLANEELERVFVDSLREGNSPSSEEAADLFARIDTRAQELGIVEPGLLPFWEWDSEMRSLLDANSGIRGRHFASPEKYRLLRSLL